MDRLKELINRYQQSVDYLAEEWNITTRHMEMGELREHKEYCQIEDDTLTYLKELKHYKDLEEQGRLIELPCKVGDDVYFIPSKTNYKLNVLNHLEENNRVYHQKIERITIAKKYYIVECDADREYGTGRYFINDSFGETWFLTKEEALARLEELKGGVE